MKHPAMFESSRFWWQSATVSVVSFLCCFWNPAQKLDFPLSRIWMKVFLHNFLQNIKHHTFVGNQNLTDTSKFFKFVFINTIIASCVKVKLIRTLIIFRLLWWCEGSVSVTDPKFSRVLFLRARLDINEHLTKTASHCIISS